MNLIGMKLRRMILTSAMVLALPFAGIAAHSIDLENIGDLTLAIQWGKTSGVYELGEGDFLRITNFTEEGNPIVSIGNKNAIIVSNHDYVTGDLILGKYFRAVGRYKITLSLLNRVDFFPKFKELSSGEVEQVEAEKHRLAAKEAQRIYEVRRMRAVRRALSEIELITDDMKIINDAYANAAKVYDKSYRETQSTSVAERVAQEFADKLINDIKCENERRLREWAKNHPEEYDAMIKAQEEERQRRAKAKLDAELAENAKRMSLFKDMVDKFRMANDHGIAPKSRKELQAFIGVRAVPKFDAWDNEYQYESNGSAFSIRSGGPDGNKGTADDIIVRVSELAEEELPINRRIAEARSEVVKKQKDLAAYKGEFIPSICGFAFGTKAKLGDDSERIVTLSRPFRQCKEAVLQYEGQYEPRLIAVCVFARFDSQDFEQSCSEGMKISNMLERKYDIKLQTVQNAGGIVSSYSGQGMEITVRNDTIMQDDPEHIILSIMFRDKHLSSKIAKLDSAVVCLEECEKAQKASAVAAPSEVKVELTDDEGFDVLTGAVKNEEVHRCEESHDKDSGEGAQVLSDEQVEELRAFRERMQTMQKEIQRSKVTASQRKAATKKTSGIIEAKSEGPVISTGESVTIKLKGGSSQGSSPRKRTR